jgi:5-formyltetrahydrofolate cyclo-ligase
MPDPANGKDTARSRFANYRRTRGNHVLMSASGEAVWRLMSAPEVAATGIVCAYASFGTEPDTAGLIEALTAAGKQVLLPVLEPDGDLDWARYDDAAEPAARLVPGRAGMREPVGPRLGRDAVVGAGVVVLPALAVSATGYRLGRGGGSYDRVLGRLRAAGPGPHGAAVWTCALVYDGELDAEFPVEGHDQPVAAACSPSRLVRFAPVG